MITRTATKKAGRWYVKGFWLFFRRPGIKNWLKTPLPFTSRKAIEAFLNKTKKHFPKDENKIVEGTKQISQKYVRNGRAIFHS